MLDPARLRGIGRRNLEGDADGEYAARAAAAGATYFASPSSRVRRTKSASRAARSSGAAAGSSPARMNPCPAPSWTTGSKGLERLWLTTDPGTRAQRFYERAGWVNRGLQANGELRHERSAD